MRVPAATAVIAVLFFTAPAVSAAQALTGTPSDDTLVGTAASDELRGGGGNDTLRGRGEADRLYGGSGNDDVFGGRGADLIWAGQGNDWVRASAGRDEIRTRAGRDTVQLGTSGPSRTWTGAGNDAVIAYDVDGNRDVVFCGPGRDSVYYWGEIDPDDRYIGCEQVSNAAH
jgi:Ca2+-binding RTX toxin-like protein